MLQSETPATGISKIFERVDYTQYKVECSCTDETHSIIIELDEDINEASLSIYVTTFMPNWKKTFSRIKTALKILFTGEARYEAHILLNSQVAYNLSKTLEDCAKKAYKEK